MLLVVPGLLPSRLFFFFFFFFSSQKRVSETDLPPNFAGKERVGLIGAESTKALLRDNLREREGSGGPM